MPSGAAISDQDTFDFLDRYDPDLRRALEEGDEIVRTRPDKPHQALLEARNFLEGLLHQVAIRHGEPLVAQSETLEKYIGRLTERGYIPSAQYALVDRVRYLGNKGAHKPKPGEEHRKPTLSEAHEALEKCRQLAFWFDTGSETELSYPSPPSETNRVHEVHREPVPAPPKPKPWLGRILWIGGIGAVVLWGISQIHSSNITITRALVSHGVDSNGQPVGEANMFRAAPTDVVLFANYVNGSVSSDRVNMEIMEGPTALPGGCAGPIQRTEGFIDCAQHLSFEGNYSFRLTVNGDVVANQPFRVLDENRIRRMITGAVISRDVRNGRPASDTRSFEAGSRIGIYLDYLAGNNDTVSIQIKRSGNISGTCEPFVVGSMWGSNWCEWRFDQPGQYSFVVLIDGIETRTEEFSVQ